jgi:hypothetical protein
MRRQTEEPMDWLAVIGRALGYLCLHYSELTGRTKVEQADFLERFGIGREDAAQILGTTDASLREMQRQRAQGPAKNTAKKAAKKAAKRPVKSTAKRTAARRG